MYYVHVFKKELTGSQTYTCTKIHSSEKDMISDHNKLFNTFKSIVFNHAGDTTYKTKSNRESR